MPRRTSSNLVDAMLAEFEDIAPSSDTLNTDDILMQQQQQHSLSTVDNAQRNVAEAHDVEAVADDKSGQADTVPTIGRRRPSRRSSSGNMGKAVSSEGGLRSRRSSSSLAKGIRKAGGLRSRRSSNIAAALANLDSGAKSAIESAAGVEDETPGRQHVLSHGNLEEEEKLRELLKKGRARKRSLKRRIANLREDGTAEKLRLKELNAKLSSLEEENDTLAIELELLERKHDEALQDFKSQQTFDSAMGEEDDEGASELEGAGGMVADADDTGGSKLGRKARLQQLFESLKSEKSLLVSSLRNHRSTLKDVLLPRARKKIQQSLRNFKDDTKMTIEDLDAAREVLVPKLEAVSEAYNKVKDGFERLRDQDAEGELKLLKLSETAAKIKAERDSAGAEADEAESAVEAADMARQQAVTELAALRGNMSSLRESKMATLAAAVEDLQKELSTSAIDESSLREQVKTEMDHRKELVNQIDQLARQSDVSLKVCADGPDDAGSISEISAQIASEALQRTQQARDKVARATSDLQQKVAQLNQLREELNRSATQTAAATKAQIVSERAAKNALLAIEFERCWFKHSEQQLHVAQELSSKILIASDANKLARDRLAQAYEQELKTAAASHRAAAQATAPPNSPELGGAGTSNSDGRAAVQESKQFDSESSLDDGALATIFMEEERQSEEHSLHVSKLQTILDDLRASLNRCQEFMVPAAKRSVVAASSATTEPLEKVLVEAKKLTDEQRDQDTTLLQLRESMEYFRQQIESQGNLHAESRAEIETQTKQAAAELDEALAQQSLATQRVEEAQTVYTLLKGQSLPEREQELSTALGTIRTEENEQAAKLQSRMDELQKGFERQLADQQAAAEGFGSEAFQELQQLRLELQQTREAQESAQQEQQAIALSESTEACQTVEGLEARLEAQSITKTGIEQQERVAHEIHEEARTLLRFLESVDVASLHNGSGASDPAVQTRDQSAGVHLASVAVGALQERLEVGRRVEQSDSTDVENSTEALVVQLQGQLTSLAAQSHEAQLHAAQMLQRHWRVRLQRNAFLQQIGEIHYGRGALAAQAAWRGHLARREALKLKKERKATQLQSTWRMSRQRRDYLFIVNEKLRSRASTLVQTHVRRFFQQRRYVHDRQQRRELAAATRLQAMARGRLTQSRGILDRLRKERKALANKAEAKKQAAAAEAERQDKLRKTPHATRIQRHWRGRMGRRKAKYQAYLEDATWAAEVLQEEWRKFLMKRLSNMGSVFMSSLCKSGNLGVEFLRVNTYISSRYLRELERSQMKRLWRSVFIEMCEEAVGDPNREFWWCASVVAHAKDLLVKLRVQQKRVFGYKSTDRSQCERLAALWGHMEKAIGLPVDVGRVKLTGSAPHLGREHGSNGVAVVASARRLLQAREQAAAESGQESSTQQVLDGARPSSSSGARVQLTRKARAAAKLAEDDVWARVEVREAVATPLLVASFRGDWLRVKSIIDADISSKSDTSHKSGPCHNASRADANGIDALIMASFRGWESTVDMLCSYLPSQLAIRFDAVCKSGFTALHYAAWAGHSHIVDMLIDKKASATYACKTSNTTALFLACSGGHFGAVHTLLHELSHRFARRPQQLQNHVDAVQQSGLTALGVAVRAGHLEIVRRLVECGSANVNDRFGNFTPLILASSLNRTAIAQYLVGAGADIEASTEFGWHFKDICKFCLRCDVETLQAAAKEQQVQRQAQLQWTLESAKSVPEPSQAVEPPRSYKSLMLKKKRVKRKPLRVEGLLHNVQVFKKKSPSAAESGAI